MYVWWYVYVGVCAGAGGACLHVVVLLDLSNRHPPQPGHVRPKPMVRVELGDCVHQIMRVC